LLVRLKRWW